MQCPVHQVVTILVPGIPNYTLLMWIRELRGRTTRDVAVQIVRKYRNDKGQPRVVIVRHMGGVPEGEALENLVRLAAARSAP